MQNLKEYLLEKIEQLPETKLREVLAFIENISQKAVEQDDPILSVAGILSGDELTAADIEDQLYGKSTKKS